MLEIVSQFADTSRQFVAERGRQSRTLHGDVTHVVTVTSSRAAHVGDPLHLADTARRRHVAGAQRPDGHHHAVVDGHRCRHGRPGRLADPDQRLLADAAALKLQISKILSANSTDASNHIYVSQLAAINVKNSFCFKAVAFATKRN